MCEMTVEEILNEVRRQQWEMNNTRYKPDATLFISEDCWDTLLMGMSRESGGNIKVDPEPPRCLMGYTTVVVNGLRQYVELKENAVHGGEAGRSCFVEWRL